MHMGTMVAPCMRQEAHSMYGSAAKQVGHTLCAVIYKPIRWKYCTPSAVMTAEGLRSLDCVAAALTAESLQPDLATPESSVKNITFKHFIWHPVLREGMHSA